MQRDKTDNFIRKQLEGRKFQPSPEAWKRIQEHLDPAEKPRRKSYAMYVAAASFAGIILLASVIYLSTRGTGEGPAVKVTEVEVMKAPRKAAEPTLDVDIFVGEDAPVEVVGHKEEEAVKAMEPDVKEVSDPLDTLLASVAGKEKEEVSEEPVVLIDTSDALIGAKIDEVVAKIEDLEKDAVAVSDAEIDELLREAQREIILEAELGKKGRTVDATALLADVEYEIDQSFRDQLFEALKERLLKVRTAVATRNE